MNDRAEVARRVVRELNVLLAAGREAKARGGETLPEIVARRRQMGFSPSLEETMARPWVCPHCGSETTILSGAISLNVGDPDDSLPMCNACEKEGIAPVTGKITVTRQ